MQAVADRGNAACTGGRAGPEVGLSRRRRPAATLLYQLVQEHLETFLALSEEGTGEGFPRCVERGFPHGAFRYALDPVRRPRHA
ncbi:MAG: hypothetical protein P8Y25_10470 [Chromatiaceae bacterium]